MANRLVRPVVFDVDRAGSLGTIFDQLQRIAVNRAVFWSINRMLRESRIELDNVVADLFGDGFKCDSIIALRRLLESNLWKGKAKPVDKQVNSLLGLAEYLNEQRAIETLMSVHDKIKDVANKVFAHDDYALASGAICLRDTTFNDLDDCLRSMWMVLRQLAEKMRIDIPDRLVPAMQYDWREAFRRSWLPEEFDDQDIWDEF